MAAPGTHTIRIWDDPESRINFLETTLAGKSWEAVVYDSHGRQDLKQMAQALDKRGYATQIGKDNNGIPTLTIRRFTHEAKLLDAFSSLGFTKGIGHTFEYAGERLGNAITKARDMIGYWTGSEARRFSFIYLFGDTVLTSSAEIGKLVDKLKKTKKAGVLPDTAQGKRADRLFTFGYALAMLQSIIMMTWAREGHELVSEELTGGLKAAEAKKLDITSFKSWAGEVKDRRSAPIRILNKYALQVGSSSQILGQLFLAVSGFIRRRDTVAQAGAHSGDAAMQDALHKDRIGSYSDIATGLLSVAGWSIIGFVKEHKVDKKVEWNENFIKRIGQEVYETPNKLASACVTIASVIGIAGGKYKGNVNDQLRIHKIEDEIAAGTATSYDLQKFQEGMGKGSPLQIGGNALYLMGDATVALARNKNYSEEQVNSAQMMAAQAKGFFDALPAVLGEKEKAEYIDEMSEYLARRLSGIRKNSKEGGETDIAQIKDHITHAIHEELPERTHNLDPVAASAAAILSEVPADQRETATHRLADIIRASDHVAISTEELVAAIGRKLEARHAIGTAQYVRTKDLEQSMARLAQAIPDGNEVATSLKIFEEMKPFLAEKYQAPNPVSSADERQRFTSSIPPSMRQNTSWTGRRDAATGEAALTAGSTPTI